MNATMSSQGVLLATLAFGLAAALLAWSAIRIASNALARYHERFTAGSSKVEPPLELSFYLVGLLALL